MFECKKFNYAVFGNPINHSQSPKIHDIFSKQTGIFYTYKAVSVPVDNFSYFIMNFFKKYGQGANITAPFKQEAYFFSNKLTERAKIAGSVNTLKKINNTDILGDNTDGIGLLSDLKRLNFIKRDCSILILGSGGAVRGVLFPLLSFGCSIVILNRTIANAKKLVLEFKKYGNIKIFEENLIQKKNFDLIINATSKQVKIDMNFVPLSVFSYNTCFYDINYQIGSNTPFINWCIKIGVNFFSHGIGMLVFQAAHSFLLWHGILPETDSLISRFNKESLVTYENKIIDLDKV